MNTFALTSFPALDSARQFSIQKLDQLCANLADVPSCVETIGVAGSLGRLEAMPHSDCDLIVVLRDGVSIDCEEANNAMLAINRAVVETGLAESRSTGIFGLPTTSALLCDPSSRGRVDEDVDVFGKRIQLLLETRAVYGDEALCRLTDTVLQRYTGGFDHVPGFHHWSYLLNDVLRYLRSFSVWRQWDFSTRAGGWYVRNIKLHISRYVMFAGMIVLLGESAQHKTDAHDWIAEHIKLTPLERLAFSYDQIGDDGFNRILQNYEPFMLLMADDQSRQRLDDATLYSEQQLDNVDESFRDIMDHASAIRHEIVRFFLSRRDDWGDAFVDQLVL